MAQNLKLQNASPSHTPNSSKKFGFLGHLLFSERALQGVSLFQVSKDLNLSTYIIKDIEKGHLHTNPGYSYMLGFVRTYALYLGLNYNEIKAFLPQPDRGILENEVPLIIPPSSKQLPSVRTTVLAGIVFMVVCFYSLLSSPTQPALTLIKLDEDLKTPELRTQSMSLASALQAFLDIYYKPFQSSPQKEVELPKSFAVCFSGPSWVSLKDNSGNLIKEGILSKDDNIILPVNFKGSLHTGDAGNIYISYNHHSSKTLGKPGEVVQNFPMNLKNILQNHANLDNN
jgi:cytoskeleton protein RodZ